MSTDAIEPTGRVIAIDIALEPDAAMMRRAEAANEALRKDNEALTARVAALERAEHTTGERVEQSLSGASADRGTGRIFRTEVTDRHMTATERSPPSANSSRAGPGSSNSTWTRSDV